MAILGIFFSCAFLSAVIVVAACMLSSRFKGRVSGEKPQTTWEIGRREE